MEPEGKRGIRLMEYSASRRRDLIPAFTALELLTTLYEGVGAATRAFAIMESIENEIEARLIIGKIPLEIPHAILVFFCHKFII